MNRARVTLATLALAAICAAGCSTEKIIFDLAVSAAPNPAAGAADKDGLRWEYTIAITNPNPMGIVVQSYHHEITGTDSGYSQPLLLEEVSAIVGQFIGPGHTFPYNASRISKGLFTTGTERRIYHARGDDGKFYSGEVIILLR